MSATAPELATIDWLIIGLYFSVIAGIVVWASRRVANTTDYFLAGRHLGWFVVGASLFASKELPTDLMTHTAVRLQYE